MPKYRQRACLEDGLKLNINNLMRDGLLKPNALISWSTVWRSTYTGEPIAEARFRANLGPQEGQLEIRLNGTLQTIVLTPRPRHFGGYQWYFVCPVMNVCCSVLWRPPGASRFCSRHAWGRRRVAYRSQFLDADNRAHRGKAKIKAKLIADLDPDEWELPPKPKWMRWKTYNRLEARFDRYEAQLEDGVIELISKFMGKKFP
jgi:hypothetical protein